MRTVLLLGAGASAASAFKLPTINSFFDLESLAGFPQLRTFLDWFYGDQGLASWNLEEVLGYLDLQNARKAVWVYEGRCGTTDIERTYQQLLDYIVQRLRTDGLHCELHTKLFRQLAERDTIITMNYDLVADLALREIDPPDANGRFDQNSRIGKLSGLLGHREAWGGLPPSLMPSESLRGFYLKLHGSLDWLNCTTPGCLNNMSIFRLNEGQQEGRPCRCCGAGLRTFIVPPVARKHIEDRGRLAFLWHLAWRELIEADRVVVAGLSLPSSDFELRWLLRYACEVRPKPVGQLAVVNPNEQHWNVVRRAFAGPVMDVSYYRSLSDFIDGKRVN